MRAKFLGASFGVGLLALAAAVQAAPAGTFLSDAIKGDNAEIALGGMAAAHGQSAKVKSFGQMLVTDHTKAKADAVAVAKTEKVAAPTGMKPAAQAEATKLKGLSGAAFDKEFVTFMINDHTKAIAMFEAQAKTGDKATAALATKTLPHLRQHLATARAIPMT